MDYDSLAYGASCLTRLQYQLDKHMFVATSQPGTFPSTISLDSVWHWVEKWQYLEVGKNPSPTSFLQTFYAYQHVSSSKAEASHCVLILLVVQVCGICDCQSLNVSSYLVLHFHAGAGTCWHSLKMAAVWKLPRQSDCKVCLTIILWHQNASRLFLLILQII